MTYYVSSGTLNLINQTKPQTLSSHFWLPTQMRDRDTAELVYWLCGYFAQTTKAVFRPHRTKCWCIRLCDRKNWYKSQLILAMPQGYRAKDHVVIKTYAGSSKPQLVFDWVSVNLASRVHRIRDADRLHSEWYQFQRKSEKVCICVTF